MKRFKRFLAHDIGIDLGTANTLVYVRGKGVIINEPSIVSVNKKTKQIIAIGEDAREMVGKAPNKIQVTKPLVDGVVSDFEITEQMLRHFIKEAQKGRFVFWQYPLVVVGIPSGVTEVEKRAVENAAKSAGARKAFLVEEPIAAAIGGRLPIMKSKGHMVVDIGGGTTEVAVISLGGIVVARSLRVAGDELTDSVIQFLRDEYKLQIGEQTAENTKINIGSAYPAKKNKTIPVRGRDVITGLPKEVKVNSDQLRIALSKTVRTIVDAVRLTLEETPPELVVDIMKGGILLAGGGGLLNGLDKLISQETKMPVNIATDPLNCVVKGTGLILEDLDTYRSVLHTSSESGYS